MLSGMAFHAADTHRATSEGAARKGRLKERYGLELRTDFFSFKKSAKTGVDSIRDYTVDKNCALQGYYSASGGNFLPTFRDKLPVPSSPRNNPEERSFSVF
jgi:hypothetical protein